MIIDDRQLHAWGARASPLVAREMQVSARRWTTYWGRLTLVLFAAAPVGVVLSMAGVRALGLSQLGAEVLNGQAILLFLWVIVSVLQAADTVSFEKREGTLGLLFLTSLTPFDILLGKLAGASMRTWHGLLAVVPVLCLPVLLGGATAGDCLRLALVLANALFVGLAVTLLVSTFCRREHSAAGWSVLVLGCLFGSVPLAHVCGWQAPVLEMVNRANPVMGLRSFPETVYRLHPGSFWVEIGATHLLGWLVLAVNSLILPRVWQDRPVGGRGGDWRMQWRQWVLGGVGERRRRFRAAALGRNPMFWYASREQRTWALPWGFLVLAVFVVWAMRALWPDIGFNLPAVLFLSWCVQLVFKHWVGASAGRVFARQTDGAVEMVLVTALSHRELVTGPLRALKRRFLGPVLAVIGLEILFVWFGADISDEMERRSWMILVPLQLGTFLLDLAAVSVMGLWQGVVAKNASQAMSATNWWVLLTPWVATIALLVLTVLGPGHYGAMDAFLMMFLTSVVVDVVLTAWAWNRLNDDLRKVMFDRLAGGKPWLSGWQALGRLMLEIVRSPAETEAGRPQA